MTKGNEEVAMKLDLGSWFFKHMDRISETASKISEEGQVSSLKIEIMLLESVLWPYITHSKNEEYYENIKGWKEHQAEKELSNNKFEQKKMGEAGSALKKAQLEVKESMLKMRGLFGFAVQQGIAPGYRPPEKIVGLAIKKNIDKKRLKELGEL